MDRARNENAYIIMTRLPEPGKTKTRLLPLFSAEDCAALHEAFLRDIREMAEELRPDTALFVSYTDETEDAEERIRAYLPGADGYLPQRGETLGERMLCAFSEVFSRGYQRVVLTGTDLPELSGAQLRTAFAALSAAELVLNPTEDGGYYLVGMRRLCDVFRLDAYGGNDVFSKTLQSAETQGISVSCGARLMDLDTPEEFRRLSARYAAGGTILWRHTANWMRAHGAGFPETLRQTGSGGERRERREASE